MSNNIDYEINKELGECYLFMGEYEKAQDYYEKASEADQRKSGPYMGLAAIAMHNGDLELAYTNYSKANELNSDTKTLSGMAIVEMETGKHHMAFERFKKALSLDAGNSIALNGIVQLGYFLECLEEAIPYLEKAADEAEDMEAIRYALAGCLTSLGRDEDAKKHLEIILGVNPDNQDAQNLYAHFAA